MKGAGPAVLSTNVFPQTRNGQGTRIDGICGGQQVPLLGAIQSLPSLTEADRSLPPAVPLVRWSLGLLDLGAALAAPSSNFAAATSEPIKGPAGLFGVLHMQSK